MTITVKNRLRTTLSHEFGHVHFHTPLWEAEASQPDLPVQNPSANRQLCKRGSISSSAQTDWDGVAGRLRLRSSHNACVPCSCLVGLYKEKYGLFGPVGYASKHGQALISVVQTTYQVSVDAARTRLSKLDVLGETDANPSLFSRR